MHVMRIRHNPVGVDDMVDDNPGLRQRRYPGGLGNTHKSQPQRGCGMVHIMRIRHNPVGVDNMVYDNPG